MQTEPPDLETSVPDWLIEFPQLLRVFEQLGIEPCLFPGEGKYGESFSQVASIQGRVSPERHPRARDMCDRNRE